MNWNDKIPLKAPLEKRLRDIESRMPGILSEIKDLNYTIASGGENECRVTEDFHYEENKFYQVLAELANKYTDRCDLTHYQIDHGPDYFTSRKEITLYVNDKSKPDLRRFFMIDLDIGELATDQSSESPDFNLKKINEKNVIISYDSKPFTVNLESEINKILGKRKR